MLTLQYNSRTLMFDVYELTEDGKFYLDFIQSFDTINDAEHFIDTYNILSHMN